VERGAVRPAGAGPGAEALLGPRGPGVAVETEGAVEAVGQHQTVGGGQRDKRGGDGEGQPFDEDADLRRLAVGIAERALCRQLAHAAHAA